MMIRGKARIGSALTQGAVYSLYTSDEQGIVRLVTGLDSGKMEQEQYIPSVPDVVCTVAWTYSGACC